MPNSTQVFQGMTALQNEMQLCSLTGFLRVLEASLHCEQPYFLWDLTLLNTLVCFLGVTNIELVLSVYFEAIELLL